MDISKILNYIRSVHKEYKPVELQNNTSLLPIFKPIPFNLEYIQDTNP